MSMKVKNGFEALRNRHSMPHTKVSITLEEFHQLFTRDEGGELPLIRLLRVAWAECEEKDVGALMDGVSEFLEEAPALLIELYERS